MNNSEYGHRNPVEMISCKNDEKVSNTRQLSTYCNSCLEENVKFLKINSLYVCASPFQHISK